MAFTEDLTPFFDTDDFAVEAVFTRASATIATCNVIYDVPTEYRTMDTVSLAEDAPFLMCRTADIADVEAQDSVTIDGTAYTVAQIKDDGTGVTRIDLELYG